MRCTIIPFFLALVVPYSAFAISKTITESLEFDTQKLKSFSVETTSGDITILQIKNKNLVSVNLIKPKKYLSYSEPCLVTAFEDNDSITLKSKVTKIPGGSATASWLEKWFTDAVYNEGFDCHIQISLPNNTADISVSTVGGNVHIEESAENLTINTVSGDATVHKTSPSAINISTVSGNVKIMNANQSFGSIETTSGNININYSKVPDIGHLKLHSVSGTTSVKMPTDSVLKAKLSSISGETSVIDIKNSSQSRFSIVGHSVSGDMIIKGQ